MFGHKARRIRELERSLYEEQQNAGHWRNVAWKYAKSPEPVDRIIGSAGDWVVTLKSPVLFDDLNDKGKLKCLQESNDILVGTISKLRHQLASEFPTSWAVVR